MCGNDLSKLLKDDIVKLSQETGFTESQVKRLYDRFRWIDDNKDGAISKSDLMRIPELAINPMGEHILHTLLFDESEEIHFPKFLRTLATFQRTNSENKQLLSKKYEYAFKIFDVNKDGEVCKQDILDILEVMGGRFLSDEAKEEIAGDTVSLASLGEDRISFQDFRFSIDEEVIAKKLSIKFKTD